MLKILVIRKVERFPNYRFRPYSNNIYNHKFIKYCLCDAILSHLQIIVFLHTITFPRNASILLLPSYPK